jgi:hypothetical protein
MCDLTHLRVAFGSVGRAGCSPNHLYVIPSKRVIGVTVQDAAAELNDTNFYDNDGSTNQQNNDMNCEFPQ